MTPLMEYYYNCWEQKTDQIPNSSFFNCFRLLKVEVHDFIAFYLSFFYGTSTLQVILQMDQFDGKLFSNQFICQVVYQFFQKDYLKLAKDFINC